MEKFIVGISVVGVIVGFWFWQSWIICVIPIVLMDNIKNRVAELREWGEFQVATHRILYIASYAR